MRRETELFFEHLIHTDRSLLELLDCNYSFLTNVWRSIMESVEFTGKPSRRSALRMMSVVAFSHRDRTTVTSNPTRTSPVKRGKWVLENLLGWPRLHRRRW